MVANGAISRQGFLYYIMLYAFANGPLFSQRLRGATGGLGEGQGLVLAFSTASDRLAQRPVRLDRNQRDTSMNTRSTKHAKASIPLVVSRSRAHGAKQRAMLAVLRRHENSRARKSDISVCHPNFHKQAGGVNSYKFLQIPTNSYLTSKRIINALYKG
jgi:hypothetical protein